MADVVCLCVVVVVFLFSSRGTTSSVERSLIFFSLQVKERRESLGTSLEKLKKILTVVGIKLKEQFYTCLLLYLISFFFLFVLSKATGYFSKLRYQVAQEFSDFAPDDSWRVLRLLLH